MDKEGINVVLFCAIIQSVPNQIWRPADEKKNLCGGRVTITYRGMLNVLISVIRLPGFPWFLTNISELVTLFVAIFLFFPAY